jgi:serine protein kinase
MKWLKNNSSEHEQINKIFSFDEYAALVEKNPRQQIRTAAIYLKDMFQFYGENKQGGFQLFQAEHHNSPKLCGQFKSQKQIYNYLNTFVEEGFINKFLLLIGPNGSSKSSIVKKMMNACEDYSTSDEGAIYTFSWVFPIDNYVKGALGLANTKEKKIASNSYAHLDDTEITAIVNSDFKDHPLLLIPREARQKLIDEKLKSDNNILESVKKSYLYHGDLSQRNKSIFDALLKNYKGDCEEVLKHIRVERFQISKRYASSAVTIEPQMHVDAHIQQITMDRRLSLLPPSLQSLNLFTWTGELVYANRGMLEFSDLLKRPIDAFKYLLTTMETKTININGMITELDVFFIGTSNEIHFTAFKQHPDFNSFRGRFGFIKVPYLLDYKEEEKIYSEQVQNLKDQTLFEPHAIESLCLWSVMTRLRKPLTQTYEDKKVANLALQFGPLEKALFLSDENALSEKFDSKEKQVLRKGRVDVVTEFENDTLYEGKFGISPREIKQIIYDLSQNNKTVIYTDVLEYLHNLSERKNELDFLNIAPQGDFHHPYRFIELIDEHMLNVFDSEVRDCLGLIDDRSYEEYIEKYILNITAILKNEKIKNKVTGKFEGSDLYLVTEFENNINLKENAEDFRSHLITKLGAFSLDNPGKKIVYTEVFHDLVKLLQDSFRAEQKKIIGKISQNFMLYLEHISNEKKSQINNEQFGVIEKMISKLKSKYSYSEQGAIKLLQNLMNKRY